MLWVWQVTKLICAKSFFSQFLNPHVLQEKFIHMVFIHLHLTHQKTLRACEAQQTFRVSIIKTLEIIIKS